MAYGIWYLFFKHKDLMADKNIIEACDEYNMVMCFTGHRMFYH